MNINEILEERGKRYGQFKHNASVAQQIKFAMDQGRNVEHLESHHKEALEVIASKIARIVNGDPDYIDNWVDIAGYATLVADMLKSPD